MNCHEQSDPSLEWIRNRFFGKYRGTVVANEDKTGRGRLQISVPAVLGDLQPWALPCVPYAGAGVGFYSLPEAGTAIWVEFEGGNPSFPIWVGCFWADSELPSGAKASVKLWKTAKVEIRADDGAAKATVSSSGGGTVAIGEDVDINDGALTVS